MVIWHVDDLKIAHVEYDVNATFIDKLREEFGKHVDLTINRGSVHDYLGMTLDYSKNMKVLVQIFDYIDNMLKELQDGWVEEAAGILAANNLFQVDENNIKLIEAEALLYHHNSTKLLSISKRARPDV